MSVLLMIFKSWRNRKSSKAGNRRFNKCPRLWEVDRVTNRPETTNTMLSNGDRQAVLWYTGASTGSWNSLGNIRYTFLGNWYLARFDSSSFLSANKRAKLITPPSSFPPRPLTTAQTAQSLFEIFPSFRHFKWSHFKKRKIFPFHVLWSVLPYFSHN